MKDEIKEKIKAYYIANDIDKIIDYITNLQNENMKYDQCLTELTDNYKDMQKELTNLQDKYKGAILIGKELNKENERLKEYIKIANVSEWFKGNDELDNLLQGKSDE